MLGLLVGRSIKDAIVGLSAMGAGLAVYLSVLDIRSFWHYRVRLPLAQSCARVGFAIVVALVAEQVAKAPDVAISATWRTVLYTTGLFLAGFGYLGIAVESHRPDKRSTDKPGADEWKPTPS